MFTDELLNISLVEPNHYYQQHIQGQEDKNFTTTYFCSWTI